jgi:hypothetical protein
MSEPIRIVNANGDLLAEQTTSHPLSSYGTLVWSILDPEPAPGRAIWQQGKNVQELDNIGVRDGWLIVRQQTGILAGIIWSDGSYFADILVDRDGNAATEFSDGLRVRGGGSIGWRHGRNPSGGGLMKSKKLVQKLKKRTRRRTPNGQNRTPNAEFRAFSRARMWL